MPGRGRRVEGDALSPSLSYPFLLLPRLAGKGFETPSSTLQRGGAKCKCLTPPAPIKTSEDGRGSQFEALLLEELEVEATAMLLLPVAATDLRMCGRR